MSRSRVLVVVSAFVFCTLAALALMMPTPPRRPMVRLRGHVPVAIQSARALPPQAGAAGSQPVTLTIVLKRQDESGFRRYLRDVYDPRAQQFRRFLSQEQITAQFGPSAQAYDDVLAYLRLYGFRIVARSANRMTLTVRGKRAQAERAFSTHLGDFEVHGQRFFANDVDPAVPVFLAADIDAVVGLSNLAVPQPAQLAVALVNALNVLNWELQAVSAVGSEGLVASTASTINATLAAAEEAFWVTESLGISEMLVGFEIVGAAAIQPLARPDSSRGASHGSGRLSPRALPGTGQKIGILAFSSINPQDVADWLALTKRSASLASQVSQVAVNGGAPPGPDETDVLLAVETILTIAPAAQVVIYHAPKGPGAPGTSFQALFNTMIGDHVNVISNSSSYCEDQTTLADAQSIDNILATAAGAGISVFNATGDAGSGCSDGSANTVAVPADSPNATAVGATSPTYGPGFTYGGEVWLDGSSRIPPTGQSGYGVSNFFSRPAYQAALNPGSKRSVPDVMAPGDPRTGLAVCQADAGGCPTAQAFGGTSLSTPVWASVAALLNQGAGHPFGFLNPVLYPRANTSAFHSAASMGTNPAHAGLGSPNGDLLALALSGQSPGMPSASMSKIQATSPDPFLPFVGTVPADGSTAASVIVFLHDANGNQVAGKTVTLSAAGGHAVITPASAVSSIANGAAIFNVTDSTVENLTFAARDQTDSVTLTQTATVNFIGPPPTAAGISANPTSVADNGSATSTITVTLQGAGGVGVPGRFISLAQGNGHSVINGPSPSVTDSTGKIQFTATDSTGETVTYTATDVSDHLTVPGSAQVTFTGQNPPPCGGVATAASGFAVTSFASGFAINGCVGPVGIAFDHSGNVFISSYTDGFINRFGSSGGVAGPTTRLNSASLGGRCPAGLAFSKDLQHLYVAMQCNSTVVEIGIANGAILRTLGSVAGATGLATDPLSGDLFVSNPFGGGVYRIANPQAATPTVTLYSNPGSVDGITFAPDGTIFAKGPGANIVSIAGTNSATPGAFTTIASVPGGPDGVAVAVSLTNPPAPLFLFANRNDGIITKVDLTQNPAAISNVVTGGSRGDLIAVGPDGCFYATQSERVLRVTNADGSCPFSPTSATPALLLSPSSVTPNPAQGTSVPFTATFNNLTVPANTPVLFTVLGPNIRTSLARTNANGQAAFSYSGVFTGTDVIIATATVGSTSLTSNLGNVIWTAGKHTASCDLDLSAKTGNTGASSNLSASLFDVSVIPPVAVSGANLALAMGGQSCSSSTDGTGLAKCSLVPASSGVLPLTGTFTGSPQLLGTKCSSSFTALGTLGGQPAPVQTPILSTPGLVTFGILLAALGGMMRRRRMAG
jgi:hypothetical protein